MITGKTGTLNSPESIKMNRIYIISELCGQWGGSIERAEQMIFQSKFAGADAVKVQLWDTYRMPGEDRHLWEYLTMTKDQFLHLKDFADKINIDFFASPFHEDRFEWVLEAGLKVNKIASSMIEWDMDLCKKMVDSGLKTYCSLGKWDEVIVGKYPFYDANVLYMHCLAKYPHSESEAKSRMPDKFTGPLIGYSDHSIGINACCEAVRRGAKIIEKHFTLDHSLQCKTESAHVCSMDYKELTKLRRFCEKHVTDS